MVEKSVLLYPNNNFIGSTGIDVISFPSLFESFGTI